MRKLTLLYPLLFAVNQWLVLFVPNINDIPGKELLLPLGMTLLVTSAVWLGLLKLVKELHRASYLTLLLVIWFSYFGSLQAATVWRLASRAHLWGGLGLLLLWSLLFGFLGSRPVWQRVKKPATITTYMGIVGVCIFLLLVYRYVQFKWTGYDQAFFRDFPRPALQVSQPPDIYYIILDGYARSDVLEQVFHFDNRQFLEYLQQRGFYVAPHSQANYIHTILSLASSLNMDYLPRIRSETARDRTYLRNWLDDNAVQSALQATGYQPVVLPSGYVYTENRAYIPAELLEHYRSQTGYLEWLWMVNSVLVLGLEADLLHSPMDRFQDQQQRILASAEAAGEIARQEGAQFVFWHLVAPHPPFIFDEHGAVTPGEAYYLFDGSDRYDSFATYQQGYLTQLTYINHLMMATIDAILQNSANPPIIVLQADHGSGAYLDFFSQDNTCLFERFGILNAYLLPGFEAEAVVPNNITPVNTFRLIFNLYFNTGLEYLADTVYFSDFDQLFNYNEITEPYPPGCVGTSP